jgi:Beta-galactosidase C-terminal domain
VNFGKKTETVDLLSSEMADLLHDGMITHLALQPYDVAVLQARPTLNGASAGSRSRLDRTTDSESVAQCAR